MPTQMKMVFFSPLTLLIPWFELLIHSFLMFQIISFLEENWLFYTKEVFHSCKHHTSKFPHKLLCYDFFFF